VKKAAAYLAKAGSVTNSSENATPSMANFYRQQTSASMETPEKNQTAMKKAAVSLAKAASVAQTSKNATVAPKLAKQAAAVVPSAKQVNSSIIKTEEKLTSDEQIASLQNGLMMIHKLQSSLTRPEPGMAADKFGMKFAQGALTSELQKKDSVVWSTIDAMLGATTEAMVAMKGKSVAEKEKMMDALERKINTKSVALKNVTERVGHQQERHAEEDLLMVLKQHQKDWSMAEQLNATKSFAGSCSAAKDLLKHHNSSLPLATQLASIIDTHKAIQVAKAKATKKAAALFIQLAGSFRRARAM
jgi:hypothetical protein